MVVPKKKSEIHQPFSQHAPPPPVKLKKGQDVFFKLTPDIRHFDMTHLLIHCCLCESSHDHRCIELH